MARLQTQNAKHRSLASRAEALVPLEIPEKRPRPSTWLTVSPIHCAVVHGEHVSIQGITFNRTGKLMAVAYEYCQVHPLRESSLTGDAQAPVV